MTIFVCHHLYIYMILFRLFSNFFNAYVQLINRFMDEKYHWTIKDFILLMTIFIVTLFVIILFLYYLGMFSS
jgi:hypothetical protein